jgi:ferredoxin
MAKTDANPPMPDFATDYVLQEVDPAYLTQSVKPKQFLHIDQAECILCEGCVDICPWKCIHYLSLDAIADTAGVADPAETEGAGGFFLVDEDVCTRCALCIDRCPTGVITLGKFEGSVADVAAQEGLPAPWEIDTGQRDHKNGYVYGIRGM